MNNYLFSLINEAAIFGALAAIQVLLPNRLGLAFASVSAFAGLGGYVTIVTCQGSVLPAGLLGAALVFLVVVMALMADRLPQDYYLLATLAVLECLGALIGLAPGLGGREGLLMPPTRPVGGRDFERDMIFWTVPYLFFVIGLVHMLIKSATGAAIDRARENPGAAERWFAVRPLRIGLVATCAVVSGGAGGIYVAYHGHVSPAIFSLEFSLLVLNFTVMAGPWPGRAALAALSYWLLPYFMTFVVPFAYQSLSDVARIVWGVALIATVRLSLERRGRRNGHVRPPT